MRCPHCEGAGELTAPSFGDAVLYTRKMRGMTQDQLAKAVGISRAQITSIEIGRSDTSVTMLIAIAEALSVSPKDLIP